MSLIQLAKLLEHSIFLEVKLLIKKMEEYIKKFGNIISVLMMLMM